MRPLIIIASVALTITTNISVTMIFSRIIYSIGIAVCSLHPAPFSATRRCLCGVNQVGSQVMNVRVADLYLLLELNPFRRQLS